MRSEGVEKSTITHLEIRCHCRTESWLDSIESLLGHRFRQMQSGNFFSIPIAKTASMSVHDRDKRDTGIASYLPFSRSSMLSRYCAAASK